MLLSAHSASVEYTLMHSVNAAMKDHMKKAW